MMKYTHFLFILCSCLYINVSAQNSYGLVIGINKYFILENGQKVLDTENSKLKGCVSDAKSIKEVLVSRFGFKPADINELYDFNASEANVRQAIKDLLAKCKSGDVAVVYYSGHGFSFPHLDPQLGTQWTEAICTADFNAESRRHYIQGTELANLFGQFVDKGVTLTAIFDCCHSNSTVRLQKPGYSLAGIRKILSPDAWAQVKEPENAMSHTVSLVLYEWILEYGAKDLIVECDGAGNTEALTDWLNQHGYSTIKKQPACSGPLTWTYEALFKEPGDCSDNVQRYQFHVTDTCGHTESTTATFTIRDSQGPELRQPARDTTIVCCGQDYRQTLQGWLDRQGGAQVREVCRLNWSHNFTDQLMADLETTGGIDVVFTASDGCEAVSTSARFTVEDFLPVATDSLSAMELDLVLALLNQLPVVRLYVTESNIKQQLPAGEIPVGQLAALLDSIDGYRSALLTSQTPDGLPLLDVAGQIPKEKLEQLQGTPAMASLAGHIRALLELADPLYAEPFWTGQAQAVSSQPPLDFLFTARPDLDVETFLGSGGSTTAKELVIVSADPKQFPFTPYVHRPPSRIPGSRFLFMSATDDVQRGVEKKDENGQPRGAFTKALISILRDGSAGMDALAIFEKVKQQLSERHIPHTPSMSISPGRRNQNLFGVATNKLTVKLSATCIKVNPDKTLVLDKGTLSGLAPGNVMSFQEQGRRIDAEILSVTETRSTARIKPGFQAANFSVNALTNTSPLNKPFQLTDNYTISKPLVKVYIPNDSCTAQKQQENIEKYYRPLLLSDPDMVPFDSASGQCTKLFMRGKTYTLIRAGKETPPKPLEKLPEEVKPMSDYFIYLPVANEISAAVREFCQKDQNIALVKTPALSNLSFYCTYSKKLKGLIYVVTDQETTGKKRTNTIHTAPYYYFPAIDPKTNKPLTPQQVASQIHQTMLLFAARYGWVNKMQKK